MQVLGVVVACGNTILIPEKSPESPQSMLKVRQVPITL